LLPVSTRPACRFPRGRVGLEVRGKALVIELLVPPQPYPFAVAMKSEAALPDRRARHASASTPVSGQRPSGDALGAAALSCGAALGRRLRRRGLARRPGRLGGLLGRRPGSTGLGARPFGGSTGAAVGRAWVRLRHPTALGGLRPSAGGAGSTLAGGGGAVATLVSAFAPVREPFSPAGAACRGSVSRGRRRATAIP
jgi:hypothetical protein